MSDYTTEPLLLGWDIGGAHLKAAWLDADGHPRQIYQQPCPLWRGTDTLMSAMNAIKARLPDHTCHHALTMTGELVDGFDNRYQGVTAIVQAFQSCWPGHKVLVYAGQRGWLAPEHITADNALAIASANWLATAQMLAQTRQHGVLLDIGSTTTDIIPFDSGVVTVEGYTDADRLRLRELVYTGVTRTPVMAVTQEVLFKGATTYLMAELFANMADVYRLLEQLPAHADQAETCDGKAKTQAASAARLLRMLGQDYHADLLPAACALAQDLKNRQMAQLSTALRQVISRPALTSPPTLYGAGVGRFLAHELADAQGLCFIDVDRLWRIPASPFTPADCAPALAVVTLALPELLEQP
ncbi:MAG: hydantoinase/oxoprolinase family protein [Methylococcales bacterium]|nr:hydantoinase/oxoprolinase family protein [Methylococcales bacterium]